MAGDARAGLAELCSGVAHLYYFARPHIGSGLLGKFDAEKFASFTACYVTGFARLLTALEEHSAGFWEAFYPSTFYLDDLPHQ